MSTKKLQILSSIIKEAQNADTLDGKHAEEFVNKDEAFSMSLLWENASPASGFPQQELTIDGLDAYEGVIIQFGSSWGCARFVLRSGGISVVSMANHIYTETTRIMAMDARNIELRDNNILFIGVGFYKEMNSGNVGYSDGTLVPYRVYGIKGVTE